ncbi:MAG: Spy/CpxP family protein refolding chaperone [Colwellia sp.]|nr:Spy/CpxP family protein refolding chaperone [Colwellia sp.]MCW8864216.1 Spy/CpxP family protein refolding chaperone [Colwellia sp.]MCW9082556.1 Spy/CpxP family protein refolding chaperone [Colwellia sp.]
MNIIKSMKAISSITALCALMAVSATASVNASGYDVAFDSPKHHQRGERFKDHSMKRMIKALSLSEQQQGEIKAIRALAKEQHKELHASLQQFKKEVKVLVQAKNFDEQAFIALQGAYQPSFEQAALAKAKTKNAIFNVLSAEQQQKWLKIMEKRNKG